MDELSLLLEREIDQTSDTLPTLITINITHGLGYSKGLLHRIPMSVGMPIERSTHQIVFLVPEVLTSV